MKTTSARYEIDMCNGPLFTGILRFALPLIATNLLQLAFNAADMIVLGRFSGSPTALAAVGATGSLINLIVSMSVGISTGVNVLVANYQGSGQSKDIEDTVHTSMTLAALIGTLLLIFGVVFAPVFLGWMGTPDNVIRESTTYMRVYFLGMPITLIYNFGAAILRAIGDTKRPLIYLSISGVLNVLLNLFFVIVVKMGVAGVALATIFSQSLSAVLIIRCLLQTEGAYQLIPSKLRIHKHKLMRILQIGLPSGLQSSLFSISNVLIQSSVNSLGSTVMGGNTAAGNIEGFVYLAMNSTAQAALSFSGQNYGAKNYKRIDQTLGICLLITGIGGAIIGNLTYLLGPYLLNLYTTNPEEIAHGLARMQVVACFYFFCGMMDTFSYTVKGMGYSVAPMFISLTGACLLRIVWVYTVFATYHTNVSLFISYPISWALTTLVYLVFYLIVRKRRFQASDKLPAKT